MPWGSAGSIPNLLCPIPFIMSGFRFLPSMFPQLYRISATLLSNQSLPLKEVSKSTADFLTGYFHPTISLEKLKGQLDAYFLAMVSDTAFDLDGRLYGAIDLILNNLGVINIETDINIGISALVSYEDFSNIILEIAPKPSVR